MSVREEKGEAQRENGTGGANRVRQSEMEDSGMEENINGVSNVDIEPNVMQVVGVRGKIAEDGELVPVCTVDKVDKVEGLRVFQESQYLESEDGRMINGVMKENDHPLMKQSGGKQWKRMVHNGDKQPVENQPEHNMGKRKSMMEWIEVEGEKDQSRNLVEAKGGQRPSATWRSLLAGRDALKKGLRRSIGNGRSTGVWMDPWVPSEAPMILPRPNHIETGDELVRDLLTEDGTSWDDGKLLARFDEEVCARIKSVPPDVDQGEDRWIWELDSKGDYSVKTGYRCIMAEAWNQFNLGLHINEDATKRFWKRMWKLPITSKFKVFLWRACLGIIPTVEALDHRGMNINEQCGMCNIEPEGAFHALVDCPELQILWVMAKFDYSSRVYHANILEWLVVEAGEWSEEQMASLAVAIYLVWERRNKKKFADEVTRVEELWPRVERVMDELQIVTLTDDRNRTEPTKWVWEKPVYPYTKLNVDASATNEGGGVMGGILRDETGACVGVYTHSVQFTNDLVLLEAMAIKRGLELAYEVGCTHLTVESDAKMVIDMLKIPCVKASTLNALCRDILRFCTNFQSVSFNWVPRLCNFIADFITRKARIDRRNVVWTDSAPLSLSEVIYAN
ncbi:ribonuclease H [Senna tora]|uniref:Ribonuclease H n=1 Tax=Senna tora TaxID=362788 RepID=A0A835CAF1_9FABA|nr:ribonuclease H [Senna tora]